MDLKTEYKKLVEEVEVRRKMSRKDIATKLGYDRTYFSSLLGSRADQVKESHIKDLRLHFPELENTTPATKDPIDLKEKVQAIRNGERNELLERAIFNLSEAELINAQNMGRLTEAELIQARNMEKMLALLEKKTEVRMELPEPGTEGTVTMKPNKKAAH